MASVDGWINCGCVHSGILLINRNEILASTRNLLADTVEGEKPDTKGYPVGDFT